MLPTQQENESGISSFDAPSLVYLYQKSEIGKPFSFGTNLLRK